MHWRPSIAVGFDRKLWRFVRDSVYHDVPLDARQWLYNPWVTLNSHGWGYCGHVAGTFVEIARAAGYEARVWGLRIPAHAGPACVKRDNHRYRGFFCQQWPRDRRWGKRGYPCARYVGKSTRPRTPTASSAACSAISIGAGTPARRYRSLIGKRASPARRRSLSRRSAVPT